MDLPRVDLHLTGDLVPIDDMVKYAVAAEDAGFGAVWVAEAFRDAFVPLAAISCATSSIQVGSNVVQWTRSLPNIELAAGDLDELCGGRFVLGIGSTTKQWNEDWHGISYDRPLQRMREYVEGIRALWTAGPQEPVTFEGEMFSVKSYLRFNGPHSRSIPIALGASRSGMAGLAGAIADNVHFNACFSPSFIAAELLPHVDKGRKDAGRASRPKVGSLTITAVDDDEATAHRWAQHQLAFYAGVADYFAELWDHHGLADEHQKVQNLFRSGDIPGAIDTVSGDAVSAMTLAGTPADVRRELHRYSDVVDHVMLYAPTFLLLPEEIAANHRAIINTFAAA